MSPRHCPACLRYSEVDVIPHRKADRDCYGVIPAFVVCGFCGWCFSERLESA